MKKAVSIFQGILIFVFTMGGIMRFVMSYEELAEQMPWVNEFSMQQIQVITLIELTGVLGLLLPWILKKHQVFMAYAAFGIALTMIGAMITHILIGDFLFQGIPSLIWLLVSLLVAKHRYAEFK